jgi:hypothetical protein
MKEQYIAHLHGSEGQVLTTLRATDLKKDALALVNETEFDFEYATIQTVYVKTVKGGE